MCLKDKKILIGITGSIAAYKMPALVRLLKKQGADLQIVMTTAAKDFVTPLTLSTLSGKPVYSQPFDSDTGAWHSHVEMGLWADAMLFAPLSAATMAKMAVGLSDNLLTTIYLSAKCPIFFAPAMDLDMYAHPTTKHNISTLQSYGMHLIAPTQGELASGLCGAGRMEEPENIVNILSAHFAQQQTFAGKKVLITAGPTQEPIDPVRYISNHSTGKMGYALAEALAARGAEVSLVSGPVSQQVKHSSIHRIDVQTAQQMYDSCTQLFPQMDIAIMAAAVADYKPSHQHPQKIKKEGQSSSNISLERNPDILKQLGHHKNEHQLVIGFALETNDAMQHAQQKLAAKHCDAIVLNSLEDKGAGFGHDTNKIHILSPHAPTQSYPLKTKQETAQDICDFIALHLMGG